MVRKFLLMIMAVVFCWGGSHLGAAEDYRASAEAAIAEERWRDGVRALQFLLAETDDPQLRAWAEAQLEALRKRIDAEAEPEDLVERARRFLRQALQREVTFAAEEWQAFYDLRRAAPDDPLIAEVLATFGPPWAAASGTDRYGRWASVRIGRLLLRLRQVPAGVVERVDGTRLELAQDLWIGESECSESLSVLVPEHARSSVVAERALSGWSVAAWEACLRALDAELASGRLRPPSADEWEYAARAGEARPWLSWMTGKDEARIDSETAGFIRQYRANAFGLYDVHGSMWELCREVDGTWSRRGGSWRSRFGDIRLDRSYPLAHSGPDPTLGLRVVFVPDESGTWLSSFPQGEGEP